MFASNYYFTYSPPPFSPEFFDDLGDKDLIQQKNEITNYYKQYAWIQSGDTLLITIAKIALACITFTAALWITMLIDHWKAEGRNRAFQERSHQLESEESLPIRDQFIRQTAEDLFRHAIKVHEKDLYQIGWEALPKDQITVENLQVQQHLNQLLLISDFNTIRARDPHQKDPDLQAAKSILYEAIKTHVKSKILPELFDQLKKNYGICKALQVCDAFSQTLSSKMGDYLFYGFFQYIAEDLPSMHFNCKWEAEENISSGETVLNDTILFLHRNYRLAAHEGDESVAKARVEMKLTIDITNLVAQGEIVIHPSATLKVEQAKAMNRAWGPIGFTMPTPTGVT